MSAHRTRISRCTVAEARHSPLTSPTHGIAPRPSRFRQTVALVARVLSQVPRPPTPKPLTRPTRFLRMLGGGLFGCTRQQLTPSSVVVYKLQLTCISRTGRAERAGERQVLGALNYWHCCQDDVKLLTSSDNTLVHSWATRLEKRGKKKKERKKALECKNNLELSALELLLRCCECLPPWCSGGSLENKSQLC